MNYSFKASYAKRKKAGTTKRLTLQSIILILYQGSSKSKWDQKTRTVSKLFNGARSFTVGEKTLALAALTPVSRSLSAGLGLPNPDIWANSLIFKIMTFALAQHQ